MSKKIQIKRGLKVGIPTLDSGELGYATDTKELFIGVDSENILINDVDGGIWEDTRDDKTGSPGPALFLEGAFAEPSEGFEELGPVGFFGAVSAEEFLGTGDWTNVMTTLDITEGDAQFSSGGEISSVFKFRHNNKIKFITKKTIRRSVSWDHIASKINVYGGTPITLNGVNYKVRLMRGFGQVSGSNSSVTTPDYENGPLYTVNFASGTGGNSGVNWPTNTSGWSANNPNEWNTLIFPIHTDSSTQTQTSDVPNWASYSNADLQIASGNGEGTWAQETRNTSTFDRVNRGFSALALVNASDGSSYFSGDGLRLVFELDIPDATKFFPAEVNN